MARLSNLRDIERLYATRGGLNYGEGVTQLEHALQCAALAQERGASPSLVVAALLHDIGHLFADEEDAVRADDRHEIAGARALGALFGEAVRRPIALHVAAKRYLCLRDADYFQALSPASQASLRLQGGPFDVAEAAAFEAMPYWQDALFLRKLDDMGKREELSGLGFEDFAAVMRSVMTSGAGA
jgi:phosphonate degradation associated HDIG domain protein